MLYQAIKLQTSENKTDKSGMKPFLHRKFPRDKTEAFHRLTWRPSGCNYQRFP